MKRYIYIIFISFLFVSIPAVTQAADSIGDNIFVDGERVILNQNYQQDVFGFGSEVTFSGQAQGDVFLVGNSVRVNGTIDGNLWVAANNVEVNADIRGSARMMVNFGTVEGRVGQNLVLIGNKLSENSTVGWHTTAYVSRLVLNGEHQRLDFSGRELEINGTVAGPVIARSVEQGYLVLGDKAVIGGAVTYQNLELTIRDGASYGKLTVKDYEGGWWHQPKLSDKIFAWLVQLFGMLTVGMLIVSIWQSRLMAFTHNLTLHIERKFLVGLAVLVGVPITIILLMLTLIGIPVALFLVVTFIISMYLSKIFIGLVLGDYLLRRIQSRPQLKQPNVAYWYGALFLGVTILMIITKLPFVGVFFSIAVVLWTLGAVALYCRGKLIESGI